MGRRAKANAHRNEKTNFVEIKTCQQRAQDHGQDDGRRNCKDEVTRSETYEQIIGCSICKCCAYTKA